MLQYIAGLLWLELVSSPRTKLKKDKSRGVVFVSQLRVMLWGHPWSAGQYQ